MRKILSGLTGLIMVAVIVSASAFAVFSSQVTVSGATLGTGTAGLLIDANFNGDWLHDTNGTTSLALGGQYIANPLLPGESDWGHIMLINDTEPGADMNVSAQLTSASGDWGVLKDVMEMRVREYTGDGTTHTFGDATEWMTLQEWHTAAQELPGNPLPANDNQEYWVEVRLPDDADNNVMGKTITDIQFVITGTTIDPEPEE